MTEPHEPALPVESPAAFFDRELSWLAFARRVLALVEDRELPLLERIKFAGIMGMLHDEFFMKRMSGIKRKMRRRPDKRSLDGRSPGRGARGLPRRDRRPDARSWSELLERGDPAGAGARGAADPRLGRSRPGGPRLAARLLRALGAADPHPAGGRRRAPVSVHQQRRPQPGGDPAAGGGHGRAVRAHQGAGQPAALGAAARRSGVRAARAGDRRQPRPALPDDAARTRSTCSASPAAPRASPTRRAT